MRASNDHPLPLRLDIAIRRHQAHLKDHGHELLIPFHPTMISMTPFVLPKANCRDHPEVVVGLRRGGNVDCRVPQQSDCFCTPKMLLVMVVGPSCRFSPRTFWKRSPHRLDSATGRSEHFQGQAYHETLQMVGGSTGRHGVVDCAFGYGTGTDIGCRDTNRRQVRSG